MALRSRGDFGANGGLSVVRPVGVGSLKCESASPVAPFTFGKALREKDDFNRRWTGCTQMKEGISEI